MSSSWSGNSHRSGMSHVDGSVSSPMHSRNASRSLLHAELAFVQEPKQSPPMQFAIAEHASSHAAARPEPPLPGMPVAVEVPGMPPVPAGFDPGPELGLPGPLLPPPPAPDGSSSTATFPPHAPIASEPSSGPKSAAARILGMTNGSDARRPTSDELQHGVASSG